MRAFIFAVLFSACSPRFDVVRAAPESPLAQAKVVVVVEPQVSDLIVNGRPEPEFSAAMTPAERQAWTSMLENARAGVMEGLFHGRRDLTLMRSGPGPTVQVSLTSVELARIEPGKVPTMKMHGLLRIVSGGSVRDEVRLTATVEAEVSTPDDMAVTRFRRFHRAGARVGNEAAEYLRYRAGLR
jgi:hypothetical protein